MRQWSPAPSSDFDDLVESPRWHDQSTLFAAACWGCVLASLGLVAVMAFGREVPGPAFAVPGALVALATLIRALARNPS
jgi:hypothetical protein